MPDINILCHLGQSRHATTGVVVPGPATRRKRLAAPAAPASGTSGNPSADAAAHARRDEDHGAGALGHAAGDPQEVPLGGHAPGGGAARRPPPVARVARRRRREAAGRRGQGAGEVVTVPPRSRSLSLLSRLPLLSSSPPRPRRCRQRRRAASNLRKPSLNPF